MESSRMVTVRPLRKPKRFRSAFTTEQIAYLERQFKKFPYISSEHRKEISTALNMQERAVKIWFQNRRMKEKKESTNKELDFINNRMESGKDRLINACSLPSTNEQLSYSLPMIVKPVNTTTTPNTDRFLRGTREIVVQIEPQNLSTNQNNSSINSHIDLHIKHQAPNLNVSQKDESSKKLFKKPVFKRSAESIDLSKRLKRTRKETSMDHKPKVQRKFELHSDTVKPRIHEDMSYKKEPQPSRIKPAKVKGPAYYPVMPTVYAHPYISPGGVIWKPVNIMPVVAPGAPIRFPNNLTQSYGQNESHKCSCNCHGISQPVPNTMNPYAQYVITGPTFENPSTKF